MKKAFNVLAIMLSIAWFAISATMCANNLTEELNAQMIKFGYYKTDIWLDAGRMIAFAGNLIGGVVALILLVWFSLWLILNRKEKHEN